MTIPLLISYTQANINSIGEDAQMVINELSGKHICQFHYCEPQRGHAKVRMIVQGFEWEMVVEIGKDHLFFVNPWFRKSRTMTPVLEEDGIVEECELFFISKNASAVATLLDMDKCSFMSEIREFILRCEGLKKPIKPLNKEKEREIWSAYCDGLNALYKERRNFITLDYVGTPISYNDSRVGDIYTLKLGIRTDSIDNITSKVQDMLKGRYRINEVTFNDDKTELCIKCKGIENFLDDDLDEVSDFLQGYGYTLPNKGIINILRVSVSYNAFKKRVDLYDQLDSQLERAKIAFVNNGDNEYKIKSDSDVQRFIDIANEVFGDLGRLVQSNKICIKLELADELRESFKTLISNKDKIYISKHKLCIIPNDEEEYYSLKKEIEKALSQVGHTLELPAFYPTYKIESQGAAASERRSIMQKVIEELSDFRKISHSFNYDEEDARVIRFEFIFNNAEERACIINQIDASVRALGDSVKLIIKNGLGSTNITFKRDEHLIQQLDDELRANYQGEEIKLVVSKAYNDSFKDITDPNDITDPVLREKYNRFMNDCPVIGKCHKRTNNIIIVKLSDEFYDGNNMEQTIRKGDMIYFPTVGTSTDLKRQYEAIQRINKPAQIVNGRKIEAPVNPRLCSFLFDPMFAHDIREDIVKMKRIISTNKIEEHLNEKQIEAVAKAVLAKDICFIQGPPGTGKTTVIAEIIWQEIRLNPKCRILLTSQTNLAVDNALERLKYKRAIRPIRVIPDQRVDNEDMIYNINQLDTWINHPNDYNKDNVVERWIDSIVDRIDKHSKHPDVTAEWREYLSKKDMNARKMFVEYYKANVNIIAATCSICGSRLFHQIYEKMYDTDDVSFDVVIIDEASKATPLEMAIPMVLGKKIVVIGDHKQLPPVLDENSIDTALRKIKREDLATKIQDLKESQFKKLFLLCQKFMPNLVTTLDTQYRMHKDIMMTINQFYVDELGENGLKCGIEDVMDEANFKIKGSRWHGIKIEPIISPSTHAIWVNVEGNEERELTSYKNDAEIRAVKLVIQMLTNADGFNEYIHAQNRMEDKEIGLITFYSAQKRELKTLEESGLLNKYYDYRIDVVDRFQGMERNIVIVSTVRSNNYNGIGFAKEIERINVAFSRARSLLIVIGNKNLFSTKYNYRKSINAMETVDIKQIEDLLRNGQ